MKIIKIINLSLALLLILLIINFFQPNLLSVGSIVYNLDLSDPQCYFENSGKSLEIPIKNCCYEIQKQLSCNDEGTKIKCFTSANSERYYLINYKTLNYCRKEGYEIELK